MGKIRIKTQNVIIIIGCLILGLFYYITEKNKQDTLLQLEREKYQFEKDKETEKKQEEDLQKFQNELSYNTCITTAYDTYLLNWNGSCKTLGKKDDCQLPSETATRWDDMLKQEKDTCYNLYKR